ncbi:MAG TPA: tetratricopeptide repeat protein [Anaeromyxobacteraceae bacterium]|nr:tetratricopeptide repeat protein [Anaeromyxobacteraceae bacterium]
MRRWLALGLSLLACSGTARRLDEANAARRAGQPREALQGYQEVLAELGEGKLPERDATLRLKALRNAADVSYLEIGDFTQAVSYYRRIVALHPGTEDAWKARAVTGDIYQQRFGDTRGAIAQWADIAQSDAPEASAYQLKVARAYVDLKNWEQARTEARILRERWSASELADEAQLLTAQSWALEKRVGEAQRAFQALIDRRPRQDVAARALEGQAGLAVEAGQLDRALTLYAEALEGHPSPETIRVALEKVRTRRDRSLPSARPGDRATAFDHRRPPPKPAAKPAPEPEPEETDEEP